MKHDKAAFLDKGEVEEPIPRNEGRSLAAALVLGVAGYLFYMGMPMILGAVAPSLGFTEQQIGWISTFQLAGLLAGAILSRWAAGVFTHRQMALNGLCLLIFGNIACVYVKSANLYCALTLLTGIGGGICYVTAIAVLSGSTYAARDIGFLTGAIVLSQAIEILMIPGFVELGGPTSLFAGLAGFGLAAVLCVRLLPRNTLPAQEPQGGEDVYAIPVDGKQWVAFARVYLLAAILANAAPGAVWTFSERIGADAGIATSKIGEALIIGSVIAAVVCAMAGRLGNIFGQHRTQIILIFLLILVNMSWCMQVGPSDYVARILLASPIWALSNVFQLTAIMKLDPGGKMTALVPVAQGAGLVIGPSTASLLLDSNLNVPSAVAFTSLFLVVALILCCGVYLLLRKRDRAAAMA